MNLFSTVATVFVMLRCIVGQETASPTVQPHDLSGEDTPYRVIPTGTDIPPGSSSTDLSTHNILGTFLYGYTGCKEFPGAKGKIDGAYYDAWVMSNTAGVASDIDWNSAAALEFLGAPGLNKAQQPKIQAVFANVATVIYSNKNPFQHSIKVRCDDPYNRCQNRPDQDPCLPNPPNPGEKAKPTPLAYSRNHDKDDTGYPMINFCQGFFNRRNLKDAVTYGKALISPANLRLSNYDNRAQTFLVSALRGPWALTKTLLTGYKHELYHLDLAANSPDPNPSVIDLQIDIKRANGPSIITFAYGTLTTKILARWQGPPGSFTSGHYVQRNADNLAYYALAKYVTTKIDNVYPHLPIVTNELDGPPYPGLVALAEFITDGSNFFLNTTEDIQAFDRDLGSGDDYPGCSDDADDNAATTAGSAISIDGFAPASAYPDDYNSQVSSWIAALNTASASASPIATAPPSSTRAITPPSSPPQSPPSYVTGQCSFHLTETQNCDSNSKNLFAVINLKDGAGNDIGDTSVEPNTDPLGEGINDAASYKFTSKLPNTLVVTGEHRKDYIQFTYGGLSWQSKTPNGGARCNNGGWDPRDGPICNSRFGITRNAVNNMDCFFPC